MKRWRKLFEGISDAVDQPLEQLVEKFQRQFAAAPIYIQPFLGYGTSDKFYLRGRVLEGEQLSPADDEDSLFDNLSATYRRFESDEVAHAHVQAQFGDVRVEGVADKEGYFAIELAPNLAFRNALVAHGTWHEVLLSLLPPAKEGQGAEQIALYRGITKVMVPPTNSNFGVISDLDDTVLQTNATSLLQVARMTFLHNARTRLPFSGVAQFYQALQQGPTGISQNPIFYVSSSPWNLYDLLSDFLDFQGIPHGPLFLRDLGLSRELISPAGHHSHKLAQVEHLLAVYPHLPFILIGDSGQEDPEIYREAVRRFPKRIAAIYIRDVSLDQRDVEIDSLIQEVGKEDVPMVRVADTVAAAEHAVTFGLIDAAALPAIQAGKQINKAL